MTDLSVEPKPAIGTPAGVPRAHRHDQRLEEPPHGSYPVDQVEGGVDAAESLRNCKKGDKTKAGDAAVREVGNDSKCYFGKGIRLDSTAEAEKERVRSSPAKEAPRYRLAGQLHASPRAPQQGYARSAIGGARAELVVASGADVESGFGNQCV
jgi:hypothetical protein